MNFHKGPMLSNLDCFLHCTTPVLKSSFLLQTEMACLNPLWHPRERETVEYFTLSDLWNSYDERSAYGAGVPIVSNDGETLVQYYVPYLSAIQIFTSRSSVNSFRKEIDSGECGERDWSSDSFSDESGKSEKRWRWEGSSSEDGRIEQDNPFHLNDRLGSLYFQYFERSAPCGRVPLMDKINSLARRSSGLMTLRSVDLSPATWMAVAWYPIYYIPMGRAIKDLSTCFLTYHTLSSSFQDVDVEADYGNGDRKKNEGDGMSLPSFGLATYKMQGSMWTSGNSGRDHNRLISLLSIADSWLKQLRVQHHDFDYFTGVGRG